MQGVSNASDDHGGLDLVVYIQEDYTVTGGVYKDEDIIFDKVVDNWRIFCQDELGFEIPAYVVEVENAIEKDWDDFVNNENAESGQEILVEIADESKKTN